MLHAIRHAPISLSCSPTRAARHYISSFLLSATQEMNHSNNHPTCAQMTPEHRTDRHTNFNTVTHTHFVFFCCCCCTALCPVILLHHPPSVPSSFLVQQFQIRLSHQFLAGQGEKKRGKKSNGNDDFSLSSSRGLSYAIYFYIPPHQLLYLTILCTEDIKKFFLKRADW